METLAENLEMVVDQVRAALGTGEEEDYFTTVTTITESVIKISLLISGASTGSGMLEAIEGFGYKTGRRKRVPDFIFVAGETLSKNGAESIMISGCSKESEVVVGYLEFSRNPQRKIQAGSWSGSNGVPIGQAEWVPAFQAMRGAIDKSRAPWWRSSRPKKPNNGAESNAQPQGG
jgi:hypothetical protein